MSKKESIISAAIDLLSVQGVHNTPMSAIAKSAGTGMGTIYNHFENKEVLINDLYLLIKEAERSAFPPFDPNAPVKTQFERYFENLVRFFIEHPKYFNLIEQLQASPLITPESREQGRASVIPLMELIDFGQKNRIIKNIPATELMQFSGGAVMSFLRGNRTDNNLEQGLANQMNLVWDGIKA